MAAYNNGYYHHYSSNPIDHLHHHTFQVFNADMSTTPPAMVEDWVGYDGGGGFSSGLVNTPPTMFSPYHSDDHVSTGYLHDALAEFNSHSKRRRLLVYTDEPLTSSDSHHLDESDWSNSNCVGWGDLAAGDLSWMMMMMMDQDNHRDRISSEEHMSGSVGDEANMFSSSSTYEMKAPTEEPPNSSSSDSSNSSIHLVSDKTTPSRILVPTASPGNEDVKKMRMKRVAAAAAKRIVYPFALVKPGGAEGDTTINDINERMLMPPARPVRHPVGDFACRPCVSPHGPGLSGKAVVALTKIQTQGRGTITIIRTRG
uniref:Protein XRI1 n=1 Tax=Kalanchoe fedtschenkoi TaxID=63787 RepID=A0A7N0TG25_KALFE